MRGVKLDHLPLYGGLRGQLYDCLRRRTRNELLNRQMLVGRLWGKFRARIRAR